MMMVAMVVVFLMKMLNNLLMTKHDNAMWLCFNIKGQNMRPACIPNWAPSSPLNLTSVDFPSFWKIFTHGLQLVWHCIGFLGCRHFTFYCLHVHHHENCIFWRTFRSASITWFEVVMWVMSNMFFIINTIISVNAIITINSINTVNGIMPCVPWSQLIQIVQVMAQPWCLNRNQHLGDKFLQKKRLYTMHITYFWREYVVQLQFRPIYS